MAVECAASDDKLARMFFPGKLSYTASLEVVQAKQTAQILLSTPDGMPILGYHKYGRGKCYYLNSCQHSCNGAPVVSPLQSSDGLRGGIQRLFELMHEEVQLN